MASSMAPCGSRSPFFLGRPLSDSNPRDGRPTRVPHMNGLRSGSRPVPCEIATNNQKRLSRCTRASLSPSTSRSLGIADPPLSHHTAARPLPADKLSRSCTNKAQSWVAASYSGVSADSQWDRPNDPNAPKGETVAGIDQSRLYYPKEVADADSRFLLFRGVDLHYKQCNPPQISSSLSDSFNEAPAVLLHGFGASLFSWEMCMPALASRLDSRVAAFDRPGFGLTPRAPPPDMPELQDPASNPYSLQFSADAALSLGAKLGKKKHKPILIGHSAGCLVALQAALTAPHQVAALVLIAPAVFPPLRKEKQPPKRSQQGRHLQHPEAFELSILNGRARAAAFGMNHFANADVQFPWSSSSSSAGGASTSDLPDEKASAETQTDTNTNSIASSTDPLRISTSLKLALSLAALYAQIAAMQILSAALAVLNMLNSASVAVVHRSAQISAAIQDAIQEQVELERVWAAVAEIVQLLWAAVAFLAAQAALLCLRVVESAVVLLAAVSSAESRQRLRVATAAAVLRNSLARAAIRRALDASGTQIVKSAWYNRDACSHHIVAGYTKPLRCRDWDSGLIEYIIGFTLNPPIATRLSQIQCPVLVVTGKDDRIVPAWNAYRVYKALPNAMLCEIPECGHVPQEEKPGVVVDLVAAFVNEHLLTCTTQS